MSSKRLITISDYSRHRFAIRVDCVRCKNVAIIDPHKLLALCNEKRWSRDMQAVEARLRCQCGSRDVRVGPVERVAPGGNEHARND